MDVNKGKGKGKREPQRAPLGAAGEATPEQEQEPEQVTFSAEPVARPPVASTPTAAAVPPPGIRTRASLRTKGPIGARYAAPPPPE